MVGVFAAAWPLLLKAVVTVPFQEMWVRSLIGSKRGDGMAALVEKGADPLDIVHLSGDLDFEVI